MFISAPNLKHKGRKAIDSANENGGDDAPNGRESAQEALAEQSRTILIIMKAIRMRSVAQ